MITPLDIQSKEFSKGVRGYREDEVDEFLDLVTLDLEKVLTENASMKEEIIRLKGELERYRGSEGAVLQTLEAAKNLMGDISASAEKRAEILLKNAELDADLITREAKDAAERLTEENQQLKIRFTEFRTKFISLLESELDRFDTLSSELFEDMEDLAVMEDSFKHKDKPLTMTRTMGLPEDDGSDTLWKTKVNIKL